MPKTAGTPANEWVAGNAREMIVTVSPAVQPPATPRTRTFPPRRTTLGVTVSETVTRLTRRLTSSPLATTMPMPAPSPALTVEELRTRVRPVRSVTQRQAMLPPAGVELAYTRLPLSWSVCAFVRHVLQSVDPRNGCTCHMSVCAVHFQSPWWTRTRFVNGTVSTPPATLAPER